MTSSNDVQREMIALLGRIVDDHSLPTDLQRRALSIVGSLAPQLGREREGASATVSPLSEAAFHAPPAAVASVVNRRLIYVHGICKHEKGYSTPWWNAFHPFEQGAFGDGILGKTRLEVQWSDIVDTAAFTAKAAAVAAHGAEGIAVAPPPILADAARQQIAEEIKESLRDRADRHAMASSVHREGLAAAPVSVGDLGDMINIPGMNCIDDFTVYLVDDGIRQEILNRFINVVGPELQAGHELDIIAHSWGTVVAYEGLRQIDVDMGPGPQVRNLFTVGAALSIGPVKLRLRDMNKDGKKPDSVRRWVNLDAHGDIVGGPLQGRPYAVDFDFLNLVPVGCSSLLGFVSPACAHGSYFNSANVAVNRDIFARFVDQA